MLSYRELDSRANALAAALQQFPGGAPQVVGIMCRNHRGFIDALAASERIGADVLLLNTSFAGPALADVVARERPSVIIYDDEFSGVVDVALADLPHIARVLAWSDQPAPDSVTTEMLIARHAGERPLRSTRKSAVILLTSGTTGTPKGARRGAGGGGTDGPAILGRLPWRAEEITVVAAPLFHAWGFGQLIMGTMLSCTLVLRRTFDPADVIYNNHNATEVGVIALAGPEDLRAAPDTAGRPMPGTQIRILDEQRREVPPGEIGAIYACTTTQFEEYTSGQTKEILDGYMATGDIGYLDDAGRLFVVGRDDEMIVSGGENVYPIEVEKALTGHPAVEDATVLGVDDEKFGQRLAAFVVLKPGAPALRKELKDRLVNT